jgi:hypothetical protein
MVKRLFGKLANRRTATLLRWKTLGPNLNEIGKMERFAERKLGFLSMGRGIARLHDRFRGKSFSKFGAASAFRGLASRVKRPAFFHGNQYVKIAAQAKWRPTIRLRAGGFRGKLGRTSRRLF